MTRTGRVRDCRRKDILAHALLAVLLAAVALRGGVTGGAAAGLGLAVAVLAASAALLGNLVPVSSRALWVALAWCGVALGSTVWSVEPDASLDAVAAILTAALVFLLAASLLGPARRQRFLLEFGVSGAIVAAVSIAWVEPGARATVPFGNANHLGAWLLLPGAIAFGHLLFADITRRGRRESAVLWFGVLGVVGAGLAISESRGATLAAFAAAAGMIAMRWTGVGPMAGGLVTAAAALCIVPSLAPDLFPMYADAGESSAGIRWGVYAAAARVALDAAPLGVGAGGFATAFSAHRPAGLPYAVGFAHSEPLHGLTELGVPYLILTALTIVLVLKRAAPRLGARAPHAARCGAGALIALGVHSLIDFPLHVPALALSGAALAGLTWSALEPECAPGTIGGTKQTRICVGSLGLVLAALCATQAIAVRAADRAHARLAAGDFAGAEAAVRDGLRVRPARGGLLALGADAAEAAFRFGGGGPAALDRALQTRAQAVRAAPRRARHWVALARTRALAGDRLGALDAVARAVQLDPHSPVARVLEVRLLLALGRPEEAVTPLRDAIHSHPAAASQMLEALFRASDDASLVRAAVPDLAGPRRQVGRMLVAAGHARAGAEELAASLALGSAEPRTALESARAFAGAGDANAAISVLRETLARLPEDPLLASELARLEAARDAQSSVPRGGTS